MKKKIKNKKMSGSAFFCDPNSGLGHKKKRADLWKHAKLV